MKCIIIVKMGVENKLTIVNKGVLVMKNMESVSKNSLISETGGVTIDGNIGDGSTITITDGSLTVNGSIGNNVIISCKTSMISLGSPFGPSGPFSNMTVNSNANVYVNGVKISTSTHETSCFVTINGTVGKNVQVDCDGDFTCTGDIPDDFRLINKVGKASTKSTTNHGNGQQTVSGHGNVQQYASSASGSSSGFSAYSYRSGNDLFMSVAGPIIINNSGGPNSSTRTKPAPK